MHFDWNAQRGRATVTSRQVPVVRIAAVAGTVGLLAVSALVIWTAVSAGIGLAALTAMALGGAVIEARAGVRGKFGDPAVHSSAASPPFMRTPCLAQSETTMEATALAHRIAIAALIDALPVRDKVAAHGRLLEIVSNRDALAGVAPGTTHASDVRAELDTVIADLRRSALASLAT